MNASAASPLPVPHFSFAPTADSTPAQAASAAADAAAHISRQPSMGPEDMREAPGLAQDQLCGLSLPYTQRLQTPGKLPLSGAHGQRAACQSCRTVALRRATCLTTSCFVVSACHACSACKCPVSHLCMADMWEIACAAAFQQHRSPPAPDLPGHHGL